MAYTVAPAWIDTAGRTRTWALRDPSGGTMAEITTKRDAEKLAALLTRVMGKACEDGASPVTALYKEGETLAREGSWARELMDSAIETLAAQLDAGRSEAMTRYLSVMSRFHRYSWGNVLLIAVQRPDATHVAGFHAWKQLGRYVKKGEHGIRILAPCHRDRTSVEEPADRDSEEREEGRGKPAASPVLEPVRRFHVVTVFDVSQTEGEDLPAPPSVKGDPGECLSRLERFAREDLGVQVEYVESLGGAYGVSMGGKVQVLRGLDEAHCFSVLCHEVAHEMLHWHGTATPAVRKDKRLVETQAEAVAFAVCHTIGLDTNTAAVDYISLYLGNRETLRQSLSAIHQAAGRILVGLEKQQT